MLCLNQAVGSHRSCEHVDDLENIEVFFVVDDLEGHFILEYVLTIYYYLNNLAFCHIL